MVSRQSALTNYCYFNGIDNDYCRFVWNISSLVVQIWFKDIQLSIIIAVSMILTMIVAGLFGILIPVTLKKMNIDPAISSSVFVTTITDVIGFLSFLGIGAYFFY